MVSARKQKLFLERSFLLLYFPLKSWADVCDITGLLWKCLFHRGFRPQVGNLQEEVWSLGKTKLVWIKMGSIWKKNSERKQYKLPITGCSKFSCEDSNTCKSILHWYARFYLNFTPWKDLYKELGGAGKEWVFALKKLLATQLLKLRRRFGLKTPSWGGGRLYLFIFLEHTIGLRE